MNRALEERLADEKHSWTEHEGVLYEFYQHTPAAEGIVSLGEGDSMVMARQVQEEIDSEEVFQTPVSCLLYD